ncbi:hypothetical protein [Xenorhabdus bovienii]|nr:hypothetical protein [Xenorhabdus bovienii]MDE1483961.1 hypothetical protein [Xenorhabdus bovienii]MDE9432772.1 hypothetical protein [Xenorhabdus bovienii]MDE9443431.1 hypothetical protein [Xenorhabdus bovienii]MDE9463261.1 hypothetical protein [Xenorhabdus bovienii]MDE9470636.1 hypothetical protein [Xenorhabdus bovienii]
MPKIQNGGKQRLGVVISPNPDSGDLLRKCYSEKQAITGEKTVTFRD